MLTLLCAVVQGAWAQASWDEVYAMTNTTEANWTALPEGTTAGATIGTAGATTYYYASKHIYYGNSIPGGSALTILGTVYIYVPYSFTVTCTGANADGQTGAGAGIELTEGNTLYLIGQGEVNATGGNAANGGDGTNGSNADWDNSNYWSGTGGAGGNGGGGAGAGIGTRGGDGGQGGAGAASVTSAWSTAGGGSGAAGQAGATAGAMGELYVVQSFVHLTTTGGAAASTSGNAGSAGKSALYDGYEYNWSAAGGGGGGGGGFGGAAANIGSGGPGGGGGGGGASGNLDWARSGYYVVKAPGGKGGQNADGTWAAVGAESIMNHHAIKNGQVKINASGWEADKYNYDSYVSSQSVGTGGSGGASGAASTNGGSMAISVVTSETTTMTSGFYYVFGDVTVPSRITIKGDVTLNLGEGAKLTASEGIELSKGNSLTINGPGALYANGHYGDKSGIGAVKVGTLVINGGVIEAHGGDHGAGIGGDIFNTDGGNITINGGVVNAYGLRGAGIGGGFSNSLASSGNPQGTGICGNIVINGGQVTAIGGYGNNIENAAGIGPGGCSPVYEYPYPQRSGSVTFNMTKPGDFVYSNTYETIRHVRVENINFASTCILEGTVEIATVSNIDGKKIVPLLDLIGTGTADDPYRISNNADWVRFAVNVNNGTEKYNGKYVQLDADIEVSMTVGTNDVNSFQGIFLGGGHTITASIHDSNSGTALFRNINGATIKDLTVAGTITGGMHAAALVGFSKGADNNIQNCTITANVSGGTHIGGILGHGTDSNISISNCVFTGLLTGGNSYKGALIGWGESGSRKVTGCLYVMAAGQNTSNLNLVNEDGSLKVEKSYYVANSNLSTNQGFIRAFVALPDNEVGTKATLTDNNTYYLLSTISVQEFYELSDTCTLNITPVVTDPYGAALTFDTDYSATLNGQDITSMPFSVLTNGDKTLTITGKGKYEGTKSISFMVFNFKGSGDTQDKPIIIENEYEWMGFTKKVNSGYNYSGKFVRLDADIEVAMTAGTSEANSFQGTFLGNGHTITASIDDNNSNGAAPFRCIKNATIKDLTVAGTITSNQRHLSGLVGNAFGTNLIEGCAVTATLNVNADYAGGFIGHGQDSKTTIRGCVFAGTINAMGKNKPNIGTIWGWSDSGTPILENCLEAGTYGNVTKMHPMGLQGGSGTITNCYYRTPQIGLPDLVCTVSGAKQVYAFNAALGIPSELVCDYGIVKAYQDGILFGDTYYRIPVAITLADNSDNSTTISNNNGYLADVTLAGRTLYRDGGWNTLCLPFSVGNINSTPLQGAKVKALASGSLSDGTLTLNFTENVSSIEAGKPYIIKWKKNIVNLSNISGDYTARDGDVLTGTLRGKCKISIAAGAMVTLQDVTINNGYKWAGISCLGDATIILKGTNTVRAFYSDYPGIYVPINATLTIQGSGSLSSNGRGAGIGGKYGSDCGNIIITGGTIRATGSGPSAGIGSSSNYDMCGNITITDGVTSVTAIKGEDALYSIGGKKGNHIVTIGGKVTGNITDSPYTYTGTGSGSVDDVVSPVFSGVTIDATMHPYDSGEAGGDQRVRFMGTYKSTEFDAEDKSILLMGGENMLFYPTAGAGLGAQRAYFKIGDDGAAGARLKAFRIDFGDSETTGIISAEANSSLFTLPSSLSNWFTLDGRKLDGKPTRKGLYIRSTSGRLQGKNNGVKVVIK